MSRSGVRLLRASKRPNICARLRSAPGQGPAACGVAPSCASKRKSGTPRSSNLLLCAPFSTGRRACLLAESALRLNTSWLYGMPELSPAKTRRHLLCLVQPDHHARVLGPAMLCTQCSRSLVTIRKCPRGRTIWDHARMRSGPFQRGSKERGKVHANLKRVIP